MSFRTDRSKKTWLSLKALCLTLLSVSLISISLNVYLYQTVINQRTTINNLTYLSTEKGLFDLIDNITRLQNEVETLQQTIISLEEDNSRLLAQNTELGDEVGRLSRQESELQRELRLFMVTVSGNVRTVNQGTWPISITFDNGIKHTVYVTDGMYRISLQNSQSYKVIVRWANDANKLWGGEEGEAGTIELYMDEETMTKDWEV